MSRVYTNRICGINIENSIASKSKGLNATIGVFFDGTGNNLYNILHNQKTNNNKTQVQHRTAIPSAGVA